VSWGPPLAYTYKFTLNARFCRFTGSIKLFSGLVEFLDLLLLVLLVTGKADKLGTGDGVL